MVRRRPPNSRGDPRHHMEPVPRPRLPADPALHTWRSRLRRTTERNATHVQVNRELRAEFAEVLCAARWDVALLQECPPRWSAALAAACRADAAALAHLTQLAWPRPRRRWPAGIPTCSAPGRAARTSPWSEARIAAGLVDHRELVLRRRPERRTMAFARLGSGLCVANLHASTSPARGGGGRAPRCRGGRRLGRRFAADPRRRLQPPAEPDRGCSRSSRAIRPQRTDRPRLHRPPPRPRARDRRAGRRAWPPEARELPCEGLATAPFGPCPGRSDDSPPETVDRTRRPGMR